MQRLIIPDLWILLSGLLWSWHQIQSRRSLCFCVWMIRWYLNLAQNLKMFQNCLTMPHTTVPTIWMDTALWVSCSAYLSGIGIKYLIFPFLLAIVCGRKKNLSSYDRPLFTTADRISSFLMASRLSNSSFRFAVAWSYFFFAAISRLSAMEKRRKPGFFMILFLFFFL